MVRSLRAVDHLWPRPETCRLGGQALSAPCPETMNAEWCFYSVLLVMLVGMCMQMNIALPHCQSWRVVLLFTLWQLSDKIEWEMMQNRTQKQVQKHSNSLVHLFFIVYGMLSDVRPVSRTICPVISLAFIDNSFSEKFSLPMVEHCR